MKDEIKDLKIKACEEKINVLENKVSTLNEEVKCNKKQLAIECKKNAEKESSCSISWFVKVNMRLILNMNNYNI